nr:sodium-dependent phosphate transport protein 4-like [Halyomorpha halys]
MTTSTAQNVPLVPMEKALVLSSFFLGYGLLQTILGNLGRRTNAVKVFSYCILISSILSLATPLAAIQFGAVGIIVVRILMGLVQGGVYPNLTTLLSIWTVPQEKAIVPPIVYHGAGFGVFVAMISSGPLAARLGWPSIFYSSGLYGCACALTVLSYTRDTTTAIGLIVVGSGLITVCSFGFLINHIDLSPNFAGILYSFTNSVANVAAILGPFISTYLIKGTSDLHEWRLVFLLTAAILVFGNTCFVLWGTTEIQEWNEVENKETQVE